MRRHSRKSGDPLTISKKARVNLGKKYYILTRAFEIVPVENYEFHESESDLKSLANKEYFTPDSRFKNYSELERIIDGLGFEWEELSDSGQMRQMPYATTMMEAIEKYSWLLAEQLSRKFGFPIYKISGGELFDSNKPELKKQIALTSKDPGLYGENYYNVLINNERQVLRYSSCIQKLSIAKGLNFCLEDLPVGLFEISKSYRFEEENELQLCNRIRSFRLPELHILTNSFNSSLEIASLTHSNIFERIKTLGSNCELLCSVTNNFFKRNKDFLKAVVKSIDKSILLVVYNEGVPCEDGVEIDIEYKTFDASGSPVEISTFQVDNGSTDSAFNIRYRSKGSKKPISTVHVVLNASVERFAYFLINETIKKRGANDSRRLPFWVAPVQARVIAYDKRSSEDAKKLAEELNLLNFRTEFDDRKINFNVKKEDRDLKWIPYVVTVRNDNKGRLVINAKGETGEIIGKNNLIMAMNAEYGKNIIVPRYYPMFLSQRLRK